MKITFLGHACLAIETNGKTIIVDPFISANDLAKDIAIDSLSADYILITHAHEDHVLDVEVIAQRTGAKLISNAEIISYYTEKGFEGHMMNTGGQWNYDFGNLKSVVAHHSSSFADGSNGGCPNGYIIESENKRIYIAGDTALTYDMKLIPETIGKLDLAVLPIGDNFTMGIDDAIVAADYVQCPRILGYHYDTFGYIKIDKDSAVEKFKNADKQLILLNIGEELTV